MKKISLVFGLLLIALGTVFAQREITGIVTDAEGEPLIGATIVISGTNQGTISDVDGTFTLRVPEGVDELIVSYTGYQTQEITLGAGNILNIRMVPGIVLGEVVVTSLGIEREKKALEYSAQSVEVEALEKSGATSVVDALAGKVAGLNIIRSSGAAGGGASMFIRGQTSLIGNNQPLIVVNGVRYNNDSYGSESSVAGTAQSNRLMDLNPNDIKEVNVLKGTAATALYGNAGSNGVIVITTKKGADRGWSVSFNSQVSFDRVSPLPNLQSEFAQGWAGAYFGPETGESTSWGPRMDTLFYDGSTDYQYDRNGRVVGQSSPNAGRSANAYDNLNSFFQTGVSYTNSIAIEGGGENARFRASYSNHLGEGIVPNNEYNRNTFRLGSSLQLFDNLSVEGSVGYTNSDHTRIQQGSNTSGLMLGMLRTPVSFDNSNGLSDPVNNPEAYRFPDGSQRNYRGGGGYDNPYWIVNLTPRVESVDRVNGNIAVNWQAHEWFNVNLNFGADFFSDIRKQEFEINSRTAPSGRVIHDDYDFNSLNAVLNFNGGNALSDFLSLRYNAGVEIYEETLENNYKEGNGLSFQDFVHITNAAGITSDQQIFSYRTLGLFGQLEVALKSQLYLTLSGRQDYDSRLIAPSKLFSSGDIGFFYPSVGLSWVFTEMLNSSVLSYGKIRGSWAQAGAAPPFAYSTTNIFIVPTPGDGWADDNQFPFRGTTGFAQSNLLRNPNLKPENSSNFELGLDLRFFSNRVGLDLSYYNRQSTDMILNASLPTTTGFTNAYLNAGEIETDGFEVVLNLSLIRTFNVNWNMTVNWGTYESTVTKLAPGLDRLQTGGFTGTGTFLVAGNPYNAIFGGAYLRSGAGGPDDDGLNLPPGDFVINDDPASSEFGYQIPDDQLRAIGDPNPDWTMGINNSIDFKGFNLSFLFDWKEGGDMWNGTDWALTFFGRSQLTADSRQEAPFALQGVKQSDGSPNDISIVRDQNYWTSSVGGFGSVDEQFVQDAGWIRLRELSISYDFGSLLFKGSNIIKGARLGFVGRNLWFDTDYTGVDPETSLLGIGNNQGLDYFNMPSSRTYLIKLGLDF